MGPRIPPVLFWLGLFFILLVGIGQFLNQSPAEQEEPTTIVVVVATPRAADTAPTSTPAPTATETTTLELLNTGARAVGQFGTNAIKATLTVLQFAVTLLGLFLLGWIGRSLVKRPRSPIIVEKISDASGDDTVGKSIDALSIWMRQRLLYYLDHVREIASDVELVKSSVTRETNSLSHIVRNTRGASTTLKEPIAHVAEAISSFAPAQFKEASKLIDTLLKPSPTTISSVLQRRGSLLSQYGISFEIASEATDTEAIIFTIWKPKVSTPGEDSNTQTAGTVILGGNGAQLPNAGMGTPPPDPNVQILEKVANHLSVAGLFEEATIYLRESLTKTPDKDELARFLVSVIGKLQKQTSDMKAYNTGKALEKAGLMDQAIDSYVRSLSALSPEAAYTLWSRALRPRQEEQTEAYLELAGAYSMEVPDPGASMYLYDASLELYSKAIEYGSQQARDENMAFRLKLANELADAGHWLYELRRFESARTIIDQAIALVPNHAKAEAVRASVEKSAPIPVSKESEAARLLGDLYWKYGAYQDARKKYETALEEDITSIKALDTLGHVLETGISADVHYHELIDPATYRLALELSRQTLENSVRRNKWSLHNIWISVKRRQTLRTSVNQSYADIYNLIGLFYQDFALEWTDHTKDFYLYAISLFEKSIHFDPNYIYAYENIADTYSMLGREELYLTTTIHQSQGFSHLREALQFYKIANNMLDNRNRTEEEEQQKHRIVVGQSITMLLMNNETLHKRARDIMYENFFDAKKKPKDTLVEDHLLYNIACFFAIAYEQRTEEQIHQQITEGREDDKLACYFLLHSLINNKKGHFWDFAEYDSELESIRQDIPQIKAEATNTIVDRVLTTS